MQPDERAAIKVVQQAAEGARLRPATGGGWILVLWGAVWLIGYLLEAFEDPRAPLFWTVVPVLAVMVSFGVGFRMRHLVQAPWGRQLAEFWGVWVPFAAAWVALFLPPTQPEGQAFIVSLVAFALSVSGLVVGRPMALGGWACSSRTYWSTWRGRPPLLGR